MLFDKLKYSRAQMDRASVIFFVLDLAESAESIMFFCLKRHFLIDVFEGLIPFCFADAFIQSNSQNKMNSWLIYRHLIFFNVYPNVLKISDVLQCVHVSANCPLGSHLLTRFLNKLNWSELKEKQSQSVWQRKMGISPFSNSMAIILIFRVVSFNDYWEDLKQKVECEWPAVTMNPEWNPAVCLTGVSVCLSVPPQEKAQWRTPLVRPCPQ